MKQVKLSEKGIGECIINSNEDLEAKSEFIIKSMAAIQMLCISKNKSEDPKLKEVIKILDDSMKKIHLLYSGDNDESDLFTDYEY
jgi:hypothetical protein